MRIKIICREGQRFGQTEDGREVGPLGDGHKNLHANRTEYLFKGEVFFGPIEEPPKGQEPESRAGWF